MSTDPKYRSYLPLSNKTFATVPIDNLDPISLKKAARNAQQSSSGKIKYTTILNQTVKALGFNGGFPEYKKTHWPKLEKFMEAKNLSEHADLIRCKSNDLVLMIFRRRDLADRIFSKKTLPEEVFTGCGVNWRDYDWNHETPGLGLELATLLSYKQKTLSEAHKDPELRKYLICYARERSLNGGGYNLIDDFLIKPRQNSEHVLFKYWVNTVPQENIDAEKKADIQYRELVKTEIEQMEHGWVEIHRYNTDLVFLIGKNGQYDFVFPNLRDRKPPTFVFSEGLTIKDIPQSFWKNNLFGYLYYYEQGHWDQKLTHESEINYYKNGGKVSEYPGQKQILIDYLGWEPPQSPKAQNHSETPVGFEPVKIPNGHLIHVQNTPVTIGEFREFMEDKEYGYSDRRYSDHECPWQPANMDVPSLPACVTYYDALAYAKWLEHKHDLPFRLLSIEEYKHIHPGPMKITTNSPRLHHTPYGWENCRLENGCVEFYLPDGSLVNQWEYFQPDVWEKLQAHYKKDLNWQTGLKNIKFLISWNFGEWLFEHDEKVAAAIKTENLTGVHDGYPICQDFHPMASWGKYKTCKIGFRLCFQTDYQH